MTTLTTAQNTLIDEIAYTVRERNIAKGVTTSSIAEPFSAEGNYDEAERRIIQGAIAILATKLVCQDPSSQLTSSQATRQFCQLKIGTSEREIFAVVFMNNENRVIAYEELFIGTIDASAVYPRDIAKRALELNAKSIIISHNHPSGILESSIADDQITQRIGIVCEMLNIRLLDHILVSAKGTMSYAENGKMPL